MVHEIILGRSDKDVKLHGNKGAVFIGKQYITMGKHVSLANKILLDVVTPHVILICGKRGSGKSYTMSVFAEGIANLPPEISEKLSCLFFDTMGIFWTMKYPNSRDADLLDEWGLEPKGFEEKIRVLVPKGKYELVKEKGIPVDASFSISCNELTGIDWCNLLRISVTSEVGVLINRVVSSLRKTGGFSIKDVVKKLSEDKKANPLSINAAVNLFETVDSWGLFEEKGTPITDLLKRGVINILDVSMYSHVTGGFSIRSLVIGIIIKRILEERMIIRKVEELRDIERGWRYFATDFRKEKENQVPLVWVFIDEAHEFLPREGKTLASDQLIQVIREGRQPGISLVLATQQPGKIHSDVITQCDLVLSHRLTARIDINALNNIMQTYLAKDLQTYLTNLPAIKGAAIVLDDKQERIYPIQVRPKFTWHGGGEPSVLETRKNVLKEGILEEE